MKKKIIAGLVAVLGICAFSFYKPSYEKIDAAVTPSRIELKACPGECTYASSFPDYAHDKLVDNIFDNEHKWYCEPGQNCYGIFYVENLAIVSKFIAYNGADTQTTGITGRRWQNWSFYGSLEHLERNSSKWVNLFTAVEGSFPFGSCTSRETANEYNSVVCASTDTVNAYKYFKVECSAYIHNQDNMQMGELDLIGIPAYEISYKDKGDAKFSGTHESGYPSYHTYGTDTSLKSATRPGYTFEGWFTSSDCSGSPITTLGGSSYDSSITLYAKWTSKVSITTSSVGGYYLNGDTKVPLAAFGFEIKSDELDSILDQISDNGFGVYIYSSKTSETPTKAFETCTKAELVKNGGRFYCIFDSGSDNTTYYAKGFFKIGDETFYSEITQATTNTNGSKYNID